jgi:hypothetical protein
MFKNRVNRPKMQEMREDWRKMHTKELYELQSSTRTIRVMK